jgi:hypothetical protein
VLLDHLVLTVLIAGYGGIAALGARNLRRARHSAARRW